MKKVSVIMLISVLVLAGCGKTESNDNPVSSEKVTDNQNAADSEKVETEQEIITETETDTQTDTVDIEQMEQIVKNYYADTVFEIVSMEVTSQSENEIVFSVCASKDGVVQEPNRTIWLQLENGEWEVVNEGF